MSESDEATQLAKLAALSPPTASLHPVIAVDLDDVLSQTNRAVAQCQFLAHFLGPLTRFPALRAQREVRDSNGTFPLLLSVFRLSMLSFQAFIYDMTRFLLLEGAFLVSPAGSDSDAIALEPILGYSTRNFREGEGFLQHGRDISSHPGSRRARRRPVPQRHGL
jgi:hypothetical protein